MRIPGIEPLQLRVLVQSQKSDVWVARHVQDAHEVLDANGLRTWKASESPKFGRFDKLVQFPHQVETFDRIVFRYSLNATQGLEQRRQLLEEARRVLKPDGLILGIVRACDSGQKLAELLVVRGVPAADLAIPNLSSRDIAALRPVHGVFLKDFVRFRERDLELIRTFVKETLKTDVKIDDQRLSGLPSEIRVNLLDAVLTWGKRNAPRR